MSDNRDIPLGPTRDVDHESIELFDAVKHDVLHKIWELHKEDERHHLSEVKKLDHVQFYKLIGYRVQEIPYGINYFGKVVLDKDGHAVHVRVFRPSATDGPIKFHALHVRPKEDGGALFGKNDPIEYFDY